MKKKNSIYGYFRLMNKFEMSKFVWNGVLQKIPKNDERRIVIIFKFVIYSEFHISYRTILFSNFFLNLTLVFIYVETLNSCLLRSRCYVRQFFLRQLFWFSLTIEEWVVFRPCFRTCHWSKLELIEVKQDNI